MKKIIYIICAVIICGMTSCNWYFEKTRPIAFRDMSKVYYIPQADIYINIVWKNMRENITMYFSKENDFPKNDTPDYERFAYILLNNSNDLIVELILKRNCDTIFIRRGESTSDIFQFSSGKLEPDTFPTPPEFERSIVYNVRSIKPWDFKFENVKYIDKNFFRYKKGKGLVLKDNVYTLSFYHNTERANSYDLILKSNNYRIILEPL